MKALLLLTGIFCAVTALGAPKSSFDQCVDSLHKRGGLSIRTAQTECLAGLSVDAQTCQNRLFLEDFQEPKRALETCRTDATQILSEKPQIKPLNHGNFEAVPATLANKKTVCSVTVNSEDERGLFRQQMKNDTYNWVELLPERDTGRFTVRDNFWLKKACAAQIKCDVLVLSGHFAESFIGESGFEVSAQDLRDASCGPECADFFKSVKEVYLFGCNTLASKKQDARSVEQYVQILTEDGLGPIKPSVWQPADTHRTELIMRLKCVLYFHRRRVFTVTLQWVLAENQSQDL